MSRFRRASSPVIATVISVAVAIAISLGIAYWMGGISGQYSGFEKIEVPTAYCTKNPTVNNSMWKIVVTLKNSGPNPSRLAYVMVNDHMVDDYNVSDGGSLTDTESVGVSMPVEGLILASGQTDTLYVWIGSGLFSSGTSVSIKIHSVSGFDYMKLVTLS